MFLHKIKEKNTSYIFIIRHAPDFVLERLFKKFNKLDGEVKGNQLFYESRLKKQTNLDSSCWPDLYFQLLTKLGKVDVEDVHKDSMQTFSKNTPKFSCYLFFWIREDMWVQIKKQRLSKIPENRSLWILSMRSCSAEVTQSCPWASSCAYQEGLRQRCFTSDLLCHVPLW